MWYALPMPRFLGRPWVRWKLRGLLGRLPSRSKIPLNFNRFNSKTRTPLRIAYLFSGTYGDFVQILKVLQTLTNALPGCDLVVWGANRYLQEFGFQLPSSIRPARAVDIGCWLIFKRNLIFTNAVGVYRVRFDFMAYFCAKQAYGFRHAHETDRGGFSNTIALLPCVKNFAEENIRLLTLAGIASSDQKEASKPWEKGEERALILFHIGSAGLKRDFGLKVYTGLIFSILNHLADKNVEVIVGPEDEDIALEVITGTRFVPKLFPVSRLIKTLETYPGTVLCFNSFFAHLCYYLNRPAIVIHRETVPYGYDCSSIHRQVVLKQKKGWDLSEVWESAGLK